MRSAKSLGSRRPHQLTRVLLGAVALYALAVLAGVAEGKTGAALERVLYIALIVCSGALCAMRALRIPEERRAWACMAAGLGCWSLGDLLYIGILADPVDPHYASVSNIFFFGFYAGTGVGMVMLARERLHGNRSLLWVDGLIVALATSALAAALLENPAKDYAENAGIASAPTIAYPVLDFILLGFAVAAIAMSGWRASRSWLLLALGTTATGAADTLYLLDLTAGGLGFTYAFLWPLSCALFAAAAWARVEPATETSYGPGPMMFMPALSGLLALAVLVYDHFSRVATSAMALAAAAILAVLIRIWMAINDAARISEEHRELGIRMAQGQRLKSLGHLAGGIAHDFNNLLSVVRNYAHLMGSGQMPDAERQVAVGEIVAACEHGAGLTQQLLLFSRRDGTARTLVDPSTALTEMARLLSRTLGDGIRLVVDASASRAAIELAPGQLEQVLVNLAVNARDAMPDGGELLIALRDVRVGDSARVPAGDYVRLDVTDTGIGMTPDVTERIFEPFFSTKPRGRGTGLGLSTVYGIVHQAGGTVTVSSEPGIGTRFSLLFPAASVPARPAAPLSEPLPFPAGERIMLVEDDEAVRESTRQILEQSGYAVSAFADGEQAMAAWREQDGRFDLIVSDVVMPRVSGPELIARVRELRPDLPCLLVSGYPETQEDDSPVTALGVPLITKPFRADELLGAIDRVLAEQRVSEALQ